ncbi:hypothetical protein [Bradymonas sediminis]|uniref:Uncharacterized protein n=1 Tax=Bradymonas sediminis TaxID=1548548 RepID=A0A2Z4FIR5_9DELT|nr:hypothetical protein [Bradymonas sediminis]AWV88578.1 hypothetical protein DN745_04190 [Bradymonas sediminis]TDP77722.1 hypothetical protein DFR33_101633 [Bradymonas sediminis]
MSKSKGEKPVSKRQKKKIVEAGLRELKNKPGWDIEAFRSRSPQEALRDFEQDFRGNRVFAKSEQCGDCLEVREQLGDDTALCDVHLAAAMGFDG